MKKELQFLMYSTPENDISVNAIIKDDTIWLTQKSMAELFGVEVPAISKHLTNIYAEGELEQHSTVSKMEIVQTEGNRQVKRTLDFYNLDEIISVGYRVNSYKATQFRIWATKVIKEYMTKGFVLDDERLKQGKTAFGKDYFRELLRGNYPLGEAIIGEEKQKAFIRIFGKILRLRNILTSFDEFEEDTLLEHRDLQDYQSVYIDLYQDFKREKDGDKESINDDIIFEIELIRQIEVNIDYILMLVAKYKDSNCKDKTILTTIDKAINSSIELRSKKELIENFIEQINISTKVDDEWKEFLSKNKEEDINRLIQEEKLKEEETRKFIDNAFRDGVMKTTGTSVDRLMPPVSRFGDGNRAIKKQGIIEKLLSFFDKYFGLI